MSEKEKKPGPNYSINLDDLDEVYVDGISSLLPGWPHTKVVFHSIVPSRPGIADGIEQRKAVLLLTISTSTLVDIAEGILSTLGRQDLQELADKNAARTQRTIAKLKKASAERAASEEAPKRAASRGSGKKAQ